MDFRGIVVRFLAQTKRPEWIQGPPQRPVQCVPEGLSTGVKTSGTEAHNKHSSGEYVMNEWRSTSSSPYTFMARVGTNFHSAKDKVKQIKVHPTTVHEGSEGRYRYRSTFSLTSALHEGVDPVAQSV
jgi:hypothetical protein